MGVSLYWESNDSEQTELKEMISNNMTQNKAMIAPLADFDSYFPLLGAKYYGCLSNSEQLVIGEVNSFLHQNFNYDFDSDNMCWKCNKTIGLDSLSIKISIFRGTNQRMVLKFHRLQGSARPFKSEMEVFETRPSVIENFVAINPSDLGETGISPSGKPKTSFCPPVPECAPLCCLDFTKTCDLLQNWVETDVEQSLMAISTTLPTIWRDLSSFNKSVETEPNQEKCIESASELITMCEKVSKLYDSLSAIVIQSYNHMNHNSPTTHHHHHYHHVEEEQHVTELAQFYNIPQAEKTMVEHEFDWLDSSPSYVDPTKVMYRAAAFHEPITIFAFDETAASGSGMNGGKMMHDNVARLMGGSTTASSVSDEANAVFSGLLSTQPQETLSYMLYLAMTCLCQQLSSNSVGSTSISAGSSNSSGSSMNAAKNGSFSQQFIHNTLKSNVDFVAVLYELVKKGNNTCGTSISSSGGSGGRCGGSHGYDFFQGHEITSYANQLWTAIMV